MSPVIELNLRPDHRALRQFGWIALLGFGFLAVLAWNEMLLFSFGLGHARTTVAGGLALLAGLSALFSLLYPRANLPVYLGLSLLTYPIGVAVSYCILAVLFYGMFTPIGFTFRRMGRDALHRAVEPERESYWMEPRPPSPRARYFRQF
ncbi:MAG: hypothetical protein JRH01_22690 [Deltaproteobacteria bacterium]|nr:hypothetical protein [Deltaproteobacteria bacterium]MBW2417441.1 hypothetical protein [Deltaproteobacteria bacterium]